MKLAGQREGTLQVKYSGNGMLQLEEVIDGGKISYFLRFREAKTEAEKFQAHNRLFPRNDEGSKKIILTDFKGNLTKYSAILDKVVSVEYIPLVDEMYTSIKLDCSASVPGTPSLKTKK
jgi:hypothetical protein